MFCKCAKYCVTYKTNYRGFEVYTRKYSHHFKVPIDNLNLEGSKVLELETMNAFIVTMRDKVLLYDQSTYKKFAELPIKLFISNTRENT